MTDDFGNEESAQDNRSGFFQKTNTPKIPKFKVYFFWGEPRVKSILKNPTVKKDSIFPLQECYITCNTLRVIFHC